jgi:hypothetical protein
VQPPDHPVLRGLDLEPEAFTKGLVLEPEAFTKGLVLEPVALGQVLEVPLGGNVGPSDRGKCSIRVVASSPRTSSSFPYCA